MKYQEHFNDYRKENENENQSRRVIRTTYSDPFPMLGIEVKVKIISPRE